MAVLMVDVSHHDWDRVDGRMDWNAVARSGIAAVTVRMTYGDPKGWHSESRHSRTMASGARSAGMMVGGYHNLIRGNRDSINRQVDWLRRELDATGSTYGMVDVERYEELLNLGLHPGITDVRAWCTRWNALEDRPLLVYLPRWVHGHMGGPDLRSLGFPLVSSDYGANAKGAPASLYAARGGNNGRGWAAYGGVAPAIWQYGSQAKVPGLSARTDINAFRGTRAQLQDLLNGEGDNDDMTPQELLNTNVGHRGPNVGIHLEKTMDTVVKLPAMLTAILTAVTADGDSAAVLAKLDEMAEAEAQRDAALLDAVSQIRTALDAHADGTLDAEDVVAQMGLLLSGLGVDGGVAS